MPKTMKWLSKNSWEERDELYTPKILVEPILKYIKPSMKIWCPFDTENSEFVLSIKELGNSVTYSHLLYDKDFFKYEPESYDVIISNPPFTRKLDVLERAYSLNVPYAFILPLTSLNYQEVGDFFLDKELQLLIVNKKVSFDGCTASFNTSYFCRGLLPKDLIFTDIENTNSGQYFVPSRMYKDFHDGQIPKEVFQKREEKKASKKQKNKDSGNKKSSS